MQNFAEDLIRSYTAGVQTRRERERRAEELEDREWQHKMRELQLKQEKLQIELAKRKATVEQINYMEQMPQRYDTEPGTREQPQAVPQGAPESVKGVLAGRMMAGPQSTWTRTPTPLPVVDIPGISEFGLPDIPHQVRSREQMQEQTLNEAYAKTRMEQQAKMVPMDIPGIGKMNVPAEAIDDVLRSIYQAREGELNRQNRLDVAGVSAQRARDLATFNQAMANARSEFEQKSAGDRAKYSAEQSEKNTRIRAKATMNAERAAWGQKPLKHLPDEPGYEIELLNETEEGAGFREEGFGRPITKLKLQQYAQQALTRGKAQDEQAAKYLALQWAVEDGWTIQ